MSPVYFSGLGAVSSAGWGLAALREALARGVPLPVQSMEWPGRGKSLRMRPVPTAANCQACLAHPRLRRASPITHYAVVAALEAMGRLQEDIDRCGRLGIVLCLQSGCVQHTYRFYEEALIDPATASPMLFPETVLAAPASHVAALLGGAPRVETLIGDPSCFLQGLALGATWLQENTVDVCLVIGAEEIKWLLACALWQFDHRAVASAGAGAVCLTLNPGLSNGVELLAITDAHTYSRRRSRAQAARAMRDQLHGQAFGELLCDGTSFSPRTDASEVAAWREWTGTRLSPKAILGEGLMAAAAWQCVAACDAVSSGRVPAATVSLVGFNHQAIGARFVRNGTKEPQ